MGVMPIAPLLQLCCPMAPPPRFTEALADLLCCGGRLQLAANHPANESGTLDQLEPIRIKGTKTNSSIKLKIKTFVSIVNI